MSPAFALALSLSLLASSPARTASSTSQEITSLLQAFLEGAGRNDPAQHERFWADDLVYTGSSGRRVGKAEILADVRSAPAPQPGDATFRYAAEDVRVQGYGDAALLAFRLVATRTHGDTVEVTKYLNSGFFVRRHGEWRAVGWQATKAAPVAP